MNILRCKIKNINYNKIMLLINLYKIKFGLSFKIILMMFLNKLI